MADEVVQEEAPKKAARKPRATAPSVVGEVVAEAKKVAEEVKQDVEAVAGQAETDVKAVEADVKVAVEETAAELNPLVAKLVDKSEADLRELHLQAIYAEDAAKRELYVLRLRAANMATNLESEVHQQVQADIVAMQQQVADAQAWLQAIESQLKGKVRDIYDSKY